MSFALLYIFIVLVFWRPQEWLFPWMFGIPVLQGITYMAILALMLEFGFMGTGQLGVRYTFESDGDLLCVCFNYSDKFTTVRYVDGERSALG